MKSKESIKDLITISLFSFKVSDQHLQTHYKESLDILPGENQTTPSFRQYYENRVKETSFVRFIVSQDTCLRFFRCKFLNNVIYIKKSFFEFGKLSLSFCCFCKTTEETPLHPFYGHVIKRMQIR